MSWAKEEMELLARLVYHWRAGPLEAGAKALAHVCLALLPRDGCSEYPLFVGRDVICGIRRTIVRLHIQEGELLWHFD